MIRFRLAELIADAQFKSGQRVTLKDVSEATGINRMTLSRMTNQRGYSTSTDTLDKLCVYFGCDVADIAHYVAPEVTNEVKPHARSSSTSKAPARKKARRAG
jgi:putative transcriptional regulator